ncbi:cytochrome P450 4c21-like isoform X1 [Nylanderia fulva]|uniref:cytochrome P450 4c21-like isoform X1 n=1 Tax=Nylanderia fulva TaxID=613905 RepID=UPI0010FB8E21|nr:cytochrome P450 4c21-like isoform X1 [Nylanderia fulva]
MIVTIILISICVVAYYYVLNYQQSSNKIKSVLPGPKTLPFIGTAYCLLQRNSDELLDTLIMLIEEYSSPLQFWMGNKLFIGINKPGQIKKILQNKHCLDKSIAYEDLLKPLFGKGLVTASASIWTKNRKMIALSFNTNTLRRSFDIFVEQSLILTKELENVGLNGNEIIFVEHVTKCTLSIACGTMTDIKMEFLSNESHQYYKAMTSFRKTFQLRGRNIFLYPNFIFNLTATGREQRKSVNFLHSFTDKIIQQQTSALNELNTKSKTRHKSFLHTLMKASHTNKLSQEMLHDNMITMLIAGTDTTAITVNFVIFMLANFPDVQIKVYTELLEIFGTKTPQSAPIKYENLEHMDYLDRVIKETLRIFPTIPLFSRQLTEDLEMEEFILPKGANVVIELLTLHRNEKFWSKPLVFDPDRFLPQNIETSYQHYYMPFSMGPRNCISMQYAIMSMKVILTTLIRTFVFKVENSIQIDKIKLTVDLVLSTVEPLKIQIEKRDMH